MYNEMYHHGIIGMKWGVRRYQNKDGTLTAAGKKRYSRDITKSSPHKVGKELDNLYKSGYNNRKFLDKYRPELEKAAERAETKAIDPELYKDLPGYNEVVDSDPQTYFDWESKNVETANEAYRRYDQAIRSEMKPVLDRYINDHRVDILKSMGYEPTQKALKWLSDNEKNIKWWYQLYPEYSGAYDWAGD